MKRITVEHIDCELRQPVPEDLDQGLFVQIDQEKCNGCNACVSICPTGAITGESGLPHTIPFADPCTHCGLCLVRCPRQAIYETRSWLSEVQEKLEEPGRICVAMPAPSVRYTLGEAFGLPGWAKMENKLISVLLKLGFRHCWDIGFAADVTIWEEGSELLRRLSNNGPFPLFSSFCASWQRYVEIFQPDLLPYVSTCKSPAAINGRLAKSWGADRYGYDPKSIYTVAIMPCPAKKHEALRPGLSFGKLKDIDAVLTVRELAWLIRKHKIDVAALAPAPADPLMGQSPGSGMFGVSGGVLDNLARFVSQKIEGKKLSASSLAHNLSEDGIHEYSFHICGMKLLFAHLQGAEQFSAICEQVRKGECPYHYVETMTCAGGCLNGGGQPLLPSLRKGLESAL